MYRLNQKVYSINGDLVGRYKGKCIMSNKYPILEQESGYCYVHFAPVQPPLEEYIVQLSDVEFRTLFAAFAHRINWDCVVVNNHWKYLMIWIENDQVFVTATNESDGEPEITFNEAMILLDKGSNNGNT